MQALAETYCKTKYQHHFLPAKRELFRPQQRFTASLLEQFADREKSRWIPKWTLSFSIFSASGRSTDTLWDRKDRLSN
jgi:hypothetical protein